MSFPWTHHFLEFDDTRPLSSHALRMPFPWSHFFVGARGRVPRPQSLHALRLSLPCGHVAIFFFLCGGRWSQMHASDRLSHKSHMACRLPLRESGARHLRLRNGLAPACVVCGCVACVCVLSRLGMACSVALGYVATCPKRGESGSSSDSETCQRRRSSDARRVALTGRWRRFSSARGGG